MAGEYEVRVSAEGPLLDSRARVQVASQEIRGAMERSVQDLERSVRIRTPQGVGAGAGLRGSIAGEVRGSGLDIRGIVGSPMAYAPVVEMGRRPGAKMPPPGALELWVRRILGVSPEDAPGVAFAVARAIGRRGIRGRFMARRALEARRGAVQALFARAAGAIARRLGGRA